MLTHASQFIAGIVTHNDYCKVLENTGKTLKCVMIGSMDLYKDGYAYGAGEEKPDPNKELGTPFRIRIIHNKHGYTYLSGSYPFCAGYGDGDNTSTRKAHWWIHNGGSNYFNTND